MTKHEHFSDISDILHSQQDIKHREESILEEEIFDETLQNIKWIEEHGEGKMEESLRPTGLNLKKYRELVDCELEKNSEAKLSEKVKSKEKYREQM